jgi:hypothetical protein
MNMKKTCDLLDEAKQCMKEKDFLVAFLRPGKMERK